MSGDYRSKQEVAHLLVPGVGRKVIDLGGNVEKGWSLLRPMSLTAKNEFNNSSSYVQVDRKRDDHGCQRVTGRDAHSWRKVWHWGPHSEQSYQRYMPDLTTFEVSHPFLEIMPAPGCAPYLLFCGQ